MSSIKNLKQYSPDGDEIANWVLEINDDKKVKHFQVHDAKTAVLHRFGTFGSPIDYSYFSSPPEDKLQEIKDKHGEPTSVRFSHCPSRPSKWGWLVVVGNKQFIVVPGGWFECTIQAGGMEGNIGGELTDV